MVASKAMIALNARYDGKVIIPDAPLPLAANQRLRVQVEAVPVSRANFRDWIGMGLRRPVNPSPRFPNDDALWES
jgi:hypothetical protein